MGEATANFEEGPVQLDKGTIVGKEWKVVKKLGEGGCGAVYLVENLITKQEAALKAESNFVEGGSVLKVEVDILARLKGKKHVTELLGAAKRSTYQYIVMSLLGESLNTLIKRCERKCSVSTQLRVGVNVLFGLKQIHDSGFVHRDIKPANLAIGTKPSTDPNIIYILDFGLSREFVEKDPRGGYRMRRPRRRILFRGTTRYCSLDVHQRKEQSRGDDLWSLLYVLVELRGRLPWHKLNEKEDLRKMKEATSDKQLLTKCPEQLHKFIAHLRTLDYWTRPNYFLLYEYLVEAMREGGYRFSDPWDWEGGGKSRSASVSTSTNKKSMKTQDDDDHNLFTDDDFKSNPLGF